jgi:hypothetical protein
MNLVTCIVSWEAMGKRVIRVVSGPNAALLYGLRASLERVSVTLRYGILFSIRS